MRVLHAARVPLGKSASQIRQAFDSQTHCSVPHARSVAVDSLRKQVAVLKGQLSRDRVLRSMQA